MARVAIKGIEELNAGVGELAKAGAAIASTALYEGAGIMADAIREKINALPVDTPRRLKDHDAFRVLVEEDKEDLANSLGIDEFEKSEDGIRTVIGFAGYGRHKTKKYKNGIPMPMLARSIESGSSVRQKHPFVRPAVNGARAAVRAKVIAFAEDEINKLIKKG